MSAMVPTLLVAVGLTVVVGFVVGVLRSGTARRLVSAPRKTSIAGTGMPDTRPAILRARIATNPYRTLQRHSSLGISPPETDQ